ncbi:FadR/GntR family transcriptional regulator [Gordonia sp. DT30]|uniref:FadR/GntR family transcriptional regulator n=1 Tax=Gordonia sp. DT30 TaxID=3416546 RepID=UPI003CEC0B24
MELLAPSRSQWRGRDSVGDEVSAHLEKLIATGELRSGDRLPSERELALHLGISRASLREAMHDLKAKHLIERRPGRGTIVMPAPEHVSAMYSELSDAEHQLRDIAQLRETIEPKLAELAAIRATSGNLRSLEDVLTRPVADVTPEESLRYDLEFHNLVASASQNHLMSAINTLAGQWTCTTRVLSHSTRHAREVSYLGHKAIYAAIATGSADGARDAMRRHLADVASLTQETFEETRDGQR